MAWLWVPKWYPATPIFSCATLNTNFLISTTVPNLYSTITTLTTASALPLLPERTPNQFITAVNLFRPALKYTWEIFDTSLAFLDIKVSIEGCGLAPVCTTKAQILVVICIHLLIHHTSRISFLILSFLDFVVFVLMTDFSLK